MKTYLHTTGEEKAAKEVLETLDEGADEEGTPMTTLAQKDVKKMPKDAVATGGATIQLATRVPATLYKRVKVFVVETDTSIMEFVGTALQAELTKRGGYAGKKAKAS